MTDEELIARLREPWFTNGCERYQRDAADRIEALQDRIKRLESAGRAYREATRHLKPCPETSAGFDAALGNKS